MRPINLLPPEAFQKAAARRRFLQIALVAVAYIALLAVLTVWWQGRVNQADDEVADQEARNQQLVAEQAALIDARELVDEFDGNVALMQAALSDDVSWGRILNDLGRVIPERVWLDSFSGTIESAEGSVGGVSVSGTAFDFPDVSSWLRQLDSVNFPGVSGTWVTSASTSLIGEAEVVNFVSSTSLTEDALSTRAAERIPDSPQ